MTKRFEVLKNSIKNLCL